MSSQNRAILPKPPGDDPFAGYAQGQSRDSKRRSTNIRVACTVCRSKRTKCDGVRPICHSCEAKGTDCFYEVPSGLTRVEAQIERIEKLETDNASLREVLGVLQNKPYGVANALLSFIRQSSMVDLHELQVWIKNRIEGDRASSSGSPASREPSLFESLDSMSRERLGLRIDSQSRSSTNELPEDVSTGASTVPETRTPTPGRGPRGPKITMRCMVNGISALFDCTGILHYTFSREQADELVRSMVEPTAVPDQTGLPDILRRSTDLRSRARFAELCAMAAVGTYYGRGSDPYKELPAGVAEFFYSVAKLTLDSSIEADPLQAMKVCLLMAIYNIANQPSVALAHIELGLSLGNRHGMDKPEIPSGLSFELFLDYKRSWRTLVLISGWLGATSGYIPAAVTGVLQLWCGEGDIDHDDIILLEVIKVTIIKSKMLHTVSDDAIANDVTINGLCQDLRDLYNELPEWMAFSTLQARIHEERIGRAVFYFHLFYLSAMQLLHRRAIANYLVADDMGGLSFAAPTSNVNYAVREGLMAAKMASRVLALMETDDEVVQNNWLCIWSAYTSGIIILHAAVRKVLNGFPFESWMADITLATTCVEVLDHCSKVDDMAPRFGATLHLYLDALRSTASSSINEDLGRDIQEEQRVEYLFGIVDGNSNLQQASRDLLSLIQRPFQASREAMQPMMARPLLQRTLINWTEAALGIPEEWIWELKNANIDVEYGTGRVDRMEEIVSTLDTAHFVEPGTDAGW